MTRLPILLLCLAPVIALAHGGGLNAEGCHNERRTGGYHCHRGGDGASARAPTRQPEEQRQATAPRPSAGQLTCHVGPRGGTYTITRSGRKNYGGC